MYLCLADKSFGKTTPYAYLKEIKSRFNAGSLPERAKNCNVYELKRDFAPVLAQQMKRFNDNTSGTTATDPNHQVCLLNYPPSFLFCQFTLASYRENRPKMDQASSDDKDVGVSTIVSGFIHSPGEVVTAGRSRGSRRCY